MAQATLVEMQFNNWQPIIDRLTQDGIPVTAASLVKESESGDWYLYLSTPLVGEDGATRPAYHHLNNVIRELQMNGLGLDPFVIKLIGPHDPIAKDLLAHRRGRPGGSPTRFHGSRLGDLAIEEAYIYPRPPTQEELAGMQLWDCGAMELKPGIKQNGRCREVVIDLEKQTVLQDRTYRGIMEDISHPLPEKRVNVTWAEGGKMRIVGAGLRSVWSQPRMEWDQGSCPPDDVVQAILTAMG